MRARLAIHASGVQVCPREILLRDKPAQFLAASPDGTVPLLQTETDLITESRDIMVWALAQNDPEGWLNIPDAGHDLIDQCDGPFKTALDHTKYAVRYPDFDPDIERAKALSFMRHLDARLVMTPFLTGPARCMADAAIYPFARQFIQIDPYWFQAQELHAVSRWVTDFCASARFAAIMRKYPIWRNDGN